MKKTHKKLDNQIRQALTIACEEIKDSFDEFSWLTHRVDFNKLPQSLHVSCYFHDQHALLDSMQQQLDNIIRHIIAKHLSDIDVKSFDISKQISFHSDD